MGNFLICLLHSQFWHMCFNCRKIEGFFRKFWCFSHGQEVPVHCSIIVCAVYIWSVLFFFTPSLASSGIYEDYKVTYQLQVIIVTSLKKSFHLFHLNKDITLSNKTEKYPLQQKGERTHITRRDGLGLQVGTMSCFSGWQRLFLHHLMCLAT